MLYDVCYQIIGSKFKILATLVMLYQSFMQICLIDLYLKLFIKSELT